MEVDVMNTITTAMSTVLDFVGTILNTITNNAILVVLLAGGTFVPLAVSIFRRIKRASR